MSDLHNRHSSSSRYHGSSRDRRKDHYNNSSSNSSSRHGSSSHRSSYGGGSAYSNDKRQRNNHHPPPSSKGDRKPASAMDFALSSVGVSGKYLKSNRSDADPNLTTRFGLPDYYPTKDSNPEEKFSEHVSKNESYVEPLPVYLVGNPACRFRQYGSMLDQARDLASQYSFFQFQKTNASKPSKVGGLLSFLKKNVRVMSERKAKDWMEDLASGKKSLEEMVLLGIPEIKWRTVTAGSPYPLLDLLVEHQPSVSRATWYIKANVLYSEKDAMTIDSHVKYGDWSLDSKRMEERARIWTTQLHQYIKNFMTNEAKSNPAKIRKTSDGGDKSSTMSSIKRQQWIYVIRLAQWQFDSSLLDSNVYFDGWISLLKVMLKDERALSSSSYMDDCFVIVTCIMHHLPKIFRSGIHVRALILAVLENLKTFSTAGENKKPNNKSFNMRSPEYFLSAKHEHLFKSLCEILRCTLLGAPDALVKIDEDFLCWPDFIFDSKFCLLEGDEVQQYLNKCIQMRNEIHGRINRIREHYHNTFISPSKYSEMEVVEALDKYHRGDLVNVEKVYPKVFYSQPTHVTNQHHVDTAGVFCVCEWAVTEGRTSPFRPLSAVAFLEYHNKAIQKQKNESSVQVCPPSMPNREARSLFLQDSLQEFLLRYEPKTIKEFYATLELFGILIRRRLFSVSPFLRYLVACGIIDPGSKDSPQFVTNCKASYTIECGPSKGFNEEDLCALSTYDRCVLYLWQLPRGSDPPPESLPVKKTASMSNSLHLNQWLVALRLSKQEVMESTPLAEAQRLAINVFCSCQRTLRPVGDAANGTHTDLTSWELSRQNLVYQLFQSLEILSQHDKGCFAQWLLQLFSNRQKYQVSVFQIDESLVTLEDMVRLIASLLNAVDVPSLMSFLCWLLVNSSLSLLRCTVLPLIEQYENAFHASSRVYQLLKCVTKRYQERGNSADDVCGRVVNFAKETYSNYASSPGVELFLSNCPKQVLKLIANDARKSKELKSKDTKADSPQLDTLDDIVKAIARTPRFTDKPPPDMQQALDLCLGELRKTSDSFRENSTSLYQECANENAMDCAVSLAAGHLKRFSAKHNEHVFIFRAMLLEVMEKWGDAVTKHKFMKATIPMGIPVQIHRCVRVLREILCKKEGRGNVGGNASTRDDSSSKAEQADKEMFSNSVLTWLFREVIPFFAGVEPNGTSSSSSKSGKNNLNPYVSQFEGQEAMALNVKGLLDTWQCGLRAFIQSLCCHGVIDLEQLVKVVIVPGFPQKNKVNSSGPKVLGTQLLTLTLLNGLLTDSVVQERINTSSRPTYEDMQMKNRMRFLRSKLPLSIVFPLMYRLCKIAYQMDKNFLLRKRDERGLGASFAFFSLTVDPTLREILFADPCSFSSSYILPLFKESQWYAAVLLSQVFRPQDEPGEEIDGRVRLRKAEEILDMISVWNVNRGGWSLMKIQLEREHFKLVQARKRSNKSVSTKSGSKNGSKLPPPGSNTDGPPSQPNSRPGSVALPPLPPSPPPPPPSASKSPPPPMLPPPPIPGSASPPPLPSSPPKSEEMSISPPPPLPPAIELSKPADVASPPLPPALPPPILSEGAESRSLLVTPTSIEKPGAPPPVEEPPLENELGMELDFGEAKDFTESLAHLVILRLLKKNSRSSRAATPLTVTSRSPMPSPSTTPGSGILALSPAESLTPDPLLAAAAVGLASYAPTSDHQKGRNSSSRFLAKGSQGAAFANLYSSLICAVSIRAPNAAIVELQEMLRKDVLNLRMRRLTDTEPILVLLRGLLVAEHGKLQKPAIGGYHSYLPYFVSGLIDQLQTILEGCLQLDDNPPPPSDPLFYRICDKVVLRLQLTAIVGPYLRQSTDGSGDRMAKVLLKLLTTSLVQNSGSVDLFTWILDTLLMVQASVMKHEHFELLSKMSLSDKLRRRVEAIFPRMSYGIAPKFIKATSVDHLIKEDGENSAGEENESTVVPFYFKLDPWTTLKQVPDASSVDSLLQGAERRRVLPSQKLFIHK